MDKRLIFEKSHCGHNARLTDVNTFDMPEVSGVLEKRLLRDELPFPCPGELEAVRHYTNLSRKNFSVDTHFYPLGSCTMKYNPKINEDAARMNSFLQLHPYQDESMIQGSLKLLHHLEELLCVITGMDHFSFQASAGAHGEFAGIRIISAYHRLKGKPRTKIIVPDSAHGTNPASAYMCGFKVIQVKSTSSGLVDIDALRSLVDRDTAGIMLTNPNTLGLFEERILDIKEIMHKYGCLMYYDGANFNPLMGIVKPSSMGFDIIHLNLHKTFSTPHGSGGPGAGALGVSKALHGFLPVPLVVKVRGRYRWEYNLPHSIGKIRSFYGNFSVLVRAYAYILRLGLAGLRRAAQVSVLNANYIRHNLKDAYLVASDKPCMHEVVFSCVKQKERGAAALDIAKCLIDYGIHPPTMYFPLIVKEALMVEPTETESRETLDNFIAAMKEIDSKAVSGSELLKNAPHTTPVCRVDEVKAARSPDLRWKKPGE